MAQATGRDGAHRLHRHPRLGGNRSIFMKAGIIIEAATEQPGQEEQEDDVSDKTNTSSEQESKDLFFSELAEISERMIAAHGKEFSMGALILAARFIAENKPLNKAEARTQ